ncbi:hypothetical protein ACI8AV_17120 [Geodermatophilus sp. SYSU D00804]
MIVAAALLVLAGLALFVLGVVTAVTAWYWACVGACALAAVLLVVARLRAPAGTRVPDAGRTPGRTDAPPRTERTSTERTRTERTSTEPPRSAGRTADRPAEAPRPGEAPAAPVRAEEAAAGEPAPAERPARAGRHEAPETDGPPAGPAAAEAPARAPAQPARGAATGASLNGGDTPEEDVEVTDLLLVVDLTDEVLVVDEHPRYHLADCPWLAGRETIPLPVHEARTDGFTPCAVCGPDAHLATVERARRAARRG